MKAEKRKKLAGEYAWKLKKEIDAGEPLDALANRDSLRFDRPEPFTRTSFVPQVGRDPIFAGTAFGLKVGEVSDPVEGIRGWYIIKLLGKTEFDEADFNRQKEALRQNLIQQKQQQAFTQWFASVKEKADIKDYRKNYF